MEQSLKSGQCQEPASSEITLDTLVGLDGEIDELKELLELKKKERDLLSVRL